MKVVITAITHTVNGEIMPNAPQMTAFWYTEHSATQIQ